MLRRRSASSLVLGLISVQLAGCALYFGELGDDDPPQAPDPYPGGSGSGSGETGGGGGSGDPLGAYTFARCEDGVIRRIGMSDLPGGDMPGHGEGLVVGHCEDGCRSAVVECTDGDCTDAYATVCEVDPALGAPTTLQGSSCSGSETVAYGETTTCGQAVPGGTCACNGSTFDCTPATGTAAVHAALVGKWHGMVTPPDFATPYPVTLWIYPDGTYWGECTQGPSYCNAFYYGGDGPHPWRRISVLSTSASTGAYADIGLFYDFNVGAISSLYVSPTTLTFTFNASWHSCGQPFTFQLTRD